MTVARGVGVALLAVLVLGAPAPARAGDPIMPLSDVRSGMRCTGLSVVRGAEISSFDVEILDVVDGQPDAGGPRILVRVSGPAVDVTGVGFGFSGSPIYCPDGQGVARNAGAISEGIGEFGNKVALATPIEQIVGESVEPPASARRAPGLRRSARPLAAPLTVTGLSRRLARAVSLAGARAGRVVLAAPAGPLASFPPQRLVPGASVAIGLSSGDVGISSIGTVAYADGDAVWAFGHPLDALGRRSLLLQDAYVYGVVNNPIAVQGAAGTYKLAAAGNALGTLTADAPAAVVGRVGPFPDLIPMTVTARDLDTGRASETSVRIADETDVGRPAGGSALALVGSLTLGQAATAILRGAPARQSGSMCVRIQLRERARPLGFCNTYVVGTGSPEEPVVLGPGVADPMVGDFLGAVSRIDSYNFAPLHLTSVTAAVRVRRGARQAFMLSASGPRRVRPGRRARVELRVGRASGARQTISLSVPVPGSLEPGSYELTLTGTPANSSSDELVVLLSEGSEEEEEAGNEGGPTSVKELAEGVAAIRRFDGVLAGFRRHGERESRGPRTRVFRDPHLRISGRARLRLRVAG